MHGQFPDGNVVVINGDELRHYHLKADKILKQDDKMVVYIRTDIKVMRLNLKTATSPDVL